MNTFSLTIVTPDGLRYEGQAEELIVRAVSGDMGILAGHINCVAPLGMGMATVKIDGEKRFGACIGGMVTVLDGAVKLVPTTFEWAEGIDIARAKLSEARAKEILADKTSSDTDIRLAEARLKRSLIRQSVAAYKPK